MAPREAIVRDAAASAPAPGASVPDPCRGGVALPPDQHYVAPGLCARAVALKQGPLRELTFAPNGDLIAVTRKGTIRRYRDRNGNGAFDAAGGEIVDWAETGGDNGQNCDIGGDYLYCGSQDGVKRWKYGAAIERGGEGEDVMVGQPGGGNHPFHPLHVYEGWMYVDSGSERNTLSPMPDDYVTDRAVIKRFDLKRFTPGTPFEWREGEVFVRGARNVTGFTRDAKGRMYGVVNGVDDLRYDGRGRARRQPGRVRRAARGGASVRLAVLLRAERVVVGGAVVPPGTPLQADAYRNVPLQGIVSSNKDDAWCAAHMTRPMSFIEAHSAPLDIVIFDGPDGALPAAGRAARSSRRTVPGTACRRRDTRWSGCRSTRMATRRCRSRLRPKRPFPMRSSSAGAMRPVRATALGAGRRRATARARQNAQENAPESAGEPVVRPVGVAVSPVDGALYVASDDQAVADQPGKLGNGVGDGAILPDWRATLTRFRSHARRLWPGAGLCG